MAPRHARPGTTGRTRIVATVLAAVLAAGAVASAAIFVTTTKEAVAGAAVRGPLRVVAISPTGSWVSPDTPLRVTFNNPLAPGSAMPTITPAVAGTWVSLSPRVLSFHASAPLLPGRTYRITVPAATATYGHETLRTAVTTTFKVADGSTLRLQQVLAQLGYLPLRFVPTGPFDPTSVAVQPGSFVWRFASVPTELSSLWQPDTYNVLTKGAIMRFEDVTGLPTLGVPTAQIWTELLIAVAHHRTDPTPYDYVLVSEDVPETLTLYVNMKPIYETLVNTGISAAPTAQATNPVYERFISTTMSGINPDGTAYDDPGIPWVSYFNGGEALHGFIRASYGWPQSLGCVEMPFAHAAVVFPYTPIGTLVTVD